MQDTQPEKQAASQFLVELVTKQLPLARAVAVAAQFNLADHLCSGPKSVAELALISQVNESALYRLLRFLNDFDIFKALDGDRFENTDISEMMRSDVPNSLRAMILWDAGPPTWQSLEGLDYSIRSGMPYTEKAFGMPFFEYLEKNPKHKQNLYQALKLFSQMTIPAVIDAYDFSPVKRLVDIGGGEGDLLRAIADHYRDIQTVLFDREEVVSGIHLPDNIDAVAGSFFEDDLPRADCFILKLILHDWDDKACIQILSACRKAIEDEGRLLIIEPARVKDSPHAAFSHMLDLDMMILTGGKERSPVEFQTLFTESGFQLTSLVSTESPLFILEARPC